MTTPTPTPEDIRAQYGFVAMLAQSVPEIGGLMQRAVSEKWTPERFQMAVASTNWWRATPAPARQWLTTQIADPATATRMMQTGGDQVDTIARDLGLEFVSPQRAQIVWLNAKLAGYDDELLEEYAINDLVFFGGGKGAMPTTGKYGALMSEARQYAADFGYTSNDLDREIFRTLIGPGHAKRPSVETAGLTWKNKMISYAKSRYAAFADRFDQGETVMDIAKPYMDVYSQTLEVNPQDVSLDDKYIQRWLQGKSEAGKPPAAVAVWQAQEELRKDARWQYTRNAWESTADVVNSVGKAFGMVG